jgi:hypothetical protein
MVGVGVFGVRWRDFNGCEEAIPCTIIDFMEADSPLFRPAAWSSAVFASI